MVGSDTPGGGGGRPDAMLKLRGLTCRFAAGAAVNAVSLDIPYGQMVGVIGRSGAGKSTLLRMINRLQQPTSGEISFGALEVTRLRGRALRDWRRGCGMVFQQFNLIPRLDVLTNVLIGRVNHRGQLASLLGLFSPAERAMALATLERFDLGRVALQRADRLSGGEQQRVAICRALMQQPRLVLADEPVASLDPENARVIMDALRRINRDDGLTVLCNLHDLGIARAYCDRIVALHRGSVVFDGSPDGLAPDVLRSIYGVDAPRNLA